MKHLLFYIFLFFINLNCYSQTYIFNNRSTSISYKKENGSTGYQKTQDLKGTFSFKFEKNLQDGKPLFTIYNNGVEDQWYGELEKRDNIQRNGEIYHQFLYLATTDNEQLGVMIAINYSKIFLIYRDRIIEYSK